MNTHQEDFALFESTVNSAFCPMAISPAEKLPDTFSYDISTHTLDLTSLTSISSDQIRVCRDVQDISQVSNSYYLVKFQLQGKGRLEQMGRSASLFPGDYTLASTSEPYRLDFDGFYKQVVLSCPQELLQRFLPAPEDFLCMPMSPQKGMPSVLSQFVSSVYKNLDTLQATELRQLEIQMLELLVMTLQQSKQVDTTVLSNERRLKDKLALAKQYIHKNINRGDLSPKVIANDIGVCLRQLHSLFEAEELTLSRYIKVQRLEMAHRMLLVDLNRSITDIALSTGFNDISHFNRCFKYFYSITPSELRKKEAPANSVLQ